MSDEMSGILTYDKERRTIGMNTDKEHVERVRRKVKTADGLGPFWRGMMLAALASIDELREKASDSQKMREALRFVRVKAIPAGGAFVRGNADREERCLEVLNIIDAALGEDAA